MLRNSQYFKLEPITNGSKAIVLAGNSYSAGLKIEIGSTVLAKYNPNEGFEYSIEGKKYDRWKLGDYTLSHWKMSETFPVRYEQEPRIKSSILRNHFREVHRGELLNVQIASNEKYDHYKYFSTNLQPNEFLFKMFENETIMFLGSEMKPLSTEDYHTLAHSKVAKELMWKNTNFLHMSFLIGQRRISYSELDFLHGDLFVETFCYNRGKLYTNKNKKAR